MKRTYTALLAMLLTAILLLGCVKGEQGGKNTETENAAQTTANPEEKPDETTDPDVVASADGETVSMSEYRVVFDAMCAQYLQYGTQPSDEELNTIRENAATQLLLQKIYIKEGKALGIELTEEEVNACAKTAQSHLDSVEKKFRRNLEQNGAVDEKALAEQVASYYKNLGIDKDAYFNMIEESEEAALYVQKIGEYYWDADTPDEETLIRFYCESVGASVYTENADGTKTMQYIPGQFWDCMKKYREGKYETPMLYLPEGFIYIDYVVLHAKTREEARELVRQFRDGERTFDELLASEENMDPYRETLPGPYPIAENDHAQLFTPQEVYYRAAALEVGQTDTFIAQDVTDEDGNTVVAVYVVRRAVGNMCMEGDFGVIDIDYFPKARASAEYNYRQSKMAERQDGWLSDVRYADSLYAYKGPLG